MRQGLLVSRYFEIGEALMEHLAIEVSGEDVFNILTTFVKGLDEVLLERLAVSAIECVG